MPIRQRCNSFILLAAMPLLALALLVCQVRSRSPAQAPTKSAQPVLQAHLAQPDLHPAPCLRLSLPRLAAVSSRWRQSGKRFDMALNAAGYVASGSGTTLVNGSYSPNGNDANGNQYFKLSSSEFLYYGGAIPNGFWVIGTVLNAYTGGNPAAYASVQYTNATAGPATSFPFTGWQPTSNGVAPAPTFTAAATSDTTAPTPNTLSFSDTTGTLTWTEAGSPPVLQAAQGIFTDTNAGIAADRGTFTYASGVDANGNKYVTNGQAGSNLRYGFFAPGSYPEWQIGPVLNGGYQDYVSSPPGVPGTFPLTGWGITGSGSPAPIFTGFNANQGLTLTGLSGGAVTLSNVTTSGTTTTFTTSRAIASTETGGSLNGAAGAFSDSASPANTTAAFTIPITSSMFGSALAPPRNLRASFID